MLYNTEQKNALAKFMKIRQPLTDEDITHWDFVMELARKVKKKYPYELSRSCEFALLHFNKHYLISCCLKVIAKKKKLNLNFVSLRVEFGDDDAHPLVVYIVMSLYYEMRLRECFLLMNRTPFYLLRDHTYPVIKEAQEKLAKYKVKTEITYPDGFPL